MKNLGVVLIFLLGFLSGPVAWIIWSYTKEFFEPLGLIALGVIIGIMILAVVGVQKIFLKE